MGHQYTFGDGQALEGDLDQFQYGLMTELSTMDVVQYDHLAWTDLHEWILLINVGLRGIENGNLGGRAGRLLVDEKEQNRSMDYREINPETGKKKKFDGGERFMGDMLDEFVARADWAANPYDACTHAPVVQADDLDLTAKHGDTVEMAVALSDQDDDALSVNWFVYNEACEYYGDECSQLAIAFETGNTIAASSNRLTIPADAAPSDYFVVICRAQDVFDAQMIRYAEFMIEIQ